MIFRTMRARLCYEENERGNVIKNKLDADLDEMLTGRGKRLNGQNANSRKLDQGHEGKQGILMEKFYLGSQMVFRILWFFYRGYRCSKTLKLLRRKGKIRFWPW